MNNISKHNNTSPLYIPYSGPSLLETPLLNKGSAFSLSEREQFNLTGLLPPRYESIDEQVARAYQQYSSFNSDLNKHIYLRAIHDNNETLFFKLVQSYLTEMMPIIYTPTVGDACEKFSDIYRSSRGLFICYEQRKNIDDILRNATKNKVKVIVVTDGERILGLGDQGIGGMGIPIGKLSLYTSCGGISPAYTLPIMLDVGTNNEKLLNDPMYMGARHKRIEQKQYDEFIDLFVQAVKRRWPQALLQFEDFAQHNATPLLTRYRNELCCFNDDIQGTACVTVGTLLASCLAQKTSLKDHRVVFVGAGSAGCGIANQIVAHMMKDGLSKDEALERVYLTSSKGLLVEGMDSIRDFQQDFVKSLKMVGSWSSKNDGRVSLLDVVKNAKPTILVGVSGQPGLMSEEIIKSMYENCQKPIIMPLSNPTSRVEAHPNDIIKWTEGNASVSTGSPFKEFSFAGKTHSFAQCNNAYIFPGIGLGVIACRSKRVTEKMFMAASDALATCSPLVKGDGKDLLPALGDIKEVSIIIAIAVARQAMSEGVAELISDDKLTKRIDASFWKPEYREYRRCSF